MTTMFDMFRQHSNDTLAVQEKKKLLSDSVADKHSRLNENIPQVPTTLSGLELATLREQHTGASDEEYIQRVREAELTKVQAAEQEESLLELTGSTIANAAASIPDLVGTVAGYSLANAAGVIQNPLSVIERAANTMGNVVGAVNQPIADLLGLGQSYQELTDIPRGLVESLFGSDSEPEVPNSYQQFMSPVTQGLEGLAEGTSNLGRGIKDSISSMAPDDSQKYNLVKDAYNTVNEQRIREKYKNISPEDMTNSDRQDMAQDILGVFGDTLSLPHAAASIVESLPAMGIAGATGKFAAKQATKGLSKKIDKSLASKGITGKQVQANKDKYLNKVAESARDKGVATGVAFTEAANSFQDTVQKYQQYTPQDFSENQEYQTLTGLGYTHEEAARHLGMQQALANAQTSAAVGYASSRLTGGGLEKALAGVPSKVKGVLGKTKEIAKQSVSEGIEEIPQAGSEAVLSNLTERNLTKKQKDLDEGVLLAEAEGAVAGLIGTGSLQASSELSKVAGRQAKKEMSRYLAAREEKRFDKKEAKRAARETEEYTDQQDISETFEMGSGVPPTSKKSKFSKADMDRVKEIKLAEVNKSGEVLEAEISRLAKEVLKHQDKAVTDTATTISKAKVLETINNYEKNITFFDGDEGNPLVSQFKAKIEALKETHKDLLASEDTRSNKQVVSDLKSTIEQVGDPDITREGVKVLFQRELDDSLTDEDIESLYETVNARDPELGKIVKAYSSIVKTLPQVSSQVLKGTGDDFFRGGKEYLTEALRAKADNDSDVMGAAIEGFNTFNQYYQTKAKDFVKAFNQSKKTGKAVTNIQKSNAEEGEYYLQLDPVTGEPSTEGEPMYVHPIKSKKLVDTIVQDAKALQSMYKEVVKLQKSKPVKKTKPIKQEVVTPDEGKVKPTITKKDSLGAIKTASAIKPLPQPVEELLDEDLFPLEDEPALVESVKPETQEDTLTTQSTEQTPSTLTGSEEIVTEAPSKPAKKEPVKLTPKSKYAYKDQYKADISNKMIGFGGKTSSTNKYSQDFGKQANSGNYSPEDKVFVSVQGGNSKEATSNLERTKEEVRVAAESGATFVTDNPSHAKRSYNIKGEGELARFLEEDMGYEGKPAYSPENKPDGMLDTDIPTVWSKAEPVEEEVVDSVPVQESELTTQEEVDNTLQEESVTDEVVETSSEEVSSIPDEMVNVKYILGTKDTMEVSQNQLIAKRNNIIKRANKKATSKTAKYVKFIVDELIKNNSKKPIKGKFTEFKDYKKAKGRVFNVLQKLGEISETSPLDDLYQVTPLETYVDKEGNPLKPNSPEYRRIEYRLANELMSQGYVKKDTEQVSYLGNGGSFLSTFLKDKLGNSPELIEYTRYWGVAEITNSFKEFSAQRLKNNTQKIKDPLYLKEDTLFQSLFHTSVPKTEDNAFGLGNLAPMFTQGAVIAMLDWFQNGTINTGIRDLATLTGFNDADEVPFTLRDMFTVTTPSGETYLNVGFSEETLVNDLGKAALEVIGLGFTGEDASTKPKITAALGLMILEYLTSGGVLNKVTYSLEELKKAGANVRVSSTHAKLTTYVPNKNHRALESRKAVKGNKPYPEVVKRQFDKLFEHIRPSRLPSLTVPKNSKAIRNSFSQLSDVEFEAMNNLSKHPHYLHSEMGQLIELFGYPLITNKLGRVSIPIDKEWQYTEDALIKIKGMNNSIIDVIDGYMEMQEHLKDDKGTPITQVPFYYPFRSTNYHRVMADTPKFSYQANKFHRFVSHTEPVEVSIATLYTGDLDQQGRDIYYSIAQGLGVKLDGKSPNQVMSEYLAERKKNTEVIKLVKSALTGSSLTPEDSAKILDTAASIHSGFELAHALSAFVEAARLEIAMDSKATTFVRKLAIEWDGRNNGPSSFLLKTQNERHQSFEKYVEKAGILTDLNSESTSSMIGKGQMIGVYEEAMKSVNNELSYTLKQVGDSEDALKNNKLLQLKNQLEIKLMGGLVTKDRNYSVIRNEMKGLVTSSFYGAGDRSFAKVDASEMLEILQETINIAYRKLATDPTHSNYKEFQVVWENANQRLSNAGGSPKFIKVPDITQNTNVVPVIKNSLKPLIRKHNLTSTHYQSLVKSLDSPPSQIIDGEEVQLPVGYSYLKTKAVRKEKPFYNKNMSHFTSAYSAMHVITTLNSISQTYTTYTYNKSVAKAREAAPISDYQDLSETELTNIQKSLLSVGTTYPTMFSNTPQEGIQLFEVTKGSKKESKRYSLGMRQKSKVYSATPDVIPSGTGAVPSLVIHMADVTAGTFAMNSETPFMFLYDGYLSFDSQVIDHANRGWGVAMANYDLLAGQQNILEHLKTSLFSVDSKGETEFHRIYRQALLNPNSIEYDFIYSFSESMLPTIYSMLPEGNTKEGRDALKTKYLRPLEVVRENNLKGKANYLPLRVPNSDIPNNVPIKDLTLDTLDAISDTPLVLKVFDSIEMDLYDSLPSIDEGVGKVLKETDKVILDQFATTNSRLTVFSKEHLVNPYPNYYKADPSRLLKFGEPESPPTQLDKESQIESGITLEGELVEENEDLDNYKEPEVTSTPEENKPTSPSSIDPSEGDFSTIDAEVEQEVESISQPDLTEDVQGDEAVQVELNLFANPLPTLTKEEFTTKKPIKPITLTDRAREVIQGNLTQLEKANSGFFGVSPELSRWYKDVLTPQLLQPVLAKGVKLPKIVGSLESNLTAKEKEYVDLFKTNPSKAMYIPSLNTIILNDTNEDLSFEPVMHEMVHWALLNSGFKLSKKDTASIRKMLKDRGWDADHIKTITENEDEVSAWVLTNLKLLRDIGELRNPELSRRVTSVLKAVKEALAKVLVKFNSVTLRIPTDSIAAYILEGAIAKISTMDSKEELSEEVRFQRDIEEIQSASPSTIFEDLLAQEELSIDHKKHLTRLFETQILSVHNSNSVNQSEFKENSIELLTSLYEEGGEVTSSELSYLFNLTPTEKYVFLSYSAIVNAGLDGLGNASQAATNIYDRALKQLEVKDFQTGNDTLEDAQAKYDAVFYGASRTAYKETAHNVSGKRKRSRYLAEFIALSQTSEEFREILNQKVDMSLRMTDVKQGNDDFSKLQKWVETIVNKVVDGLFNLRVKGIKEPSYKLRMDALSKQLTLSNYQAKSKLEKVYRDNIDKTGKLYNKYAKTADKAVTKIFNTTGIKKIGKGVYDLFDLSKTNEDESKNQKLAESLNKLRHVFLEGSLKWLPEFLEDISVTNEDNVHINRVFNKKTKAVAAYRTGYMDAVTKQVLKVLGELPKDLSEALTRSLISTNITTLTKDSTLMDVVDLFSNSQQLQEEIDTSIQELDFIEDSTQKSALINSAYSLGYFMVHGQGTEEVTFPNATAIAKVILGTNKPTTTVVNTLDRLATLVAIQQTNPIIKSKFVTLTKDKPTEVTNIVNLMRQQELHEFESILGSNPERVMKGMADTHYKALQDIQVVPVKEVAQLEEMQRQGYREIDTTKVGNTDYLVMFSEVGGLNSYTQGAFSLATSNLSGFNKLSNLEKVVSGVKRKDANRLVQTLSGSRTKRIPNKPFIANTSKGKITQAYVGLNKGVTSKYLQIDNRIEKVLPAMFGRVIEATHTDVYNQEVATALVNTWEKDLKENKLNGYLEIGPEAPTQEGREYWLRMPPVARADLANQFKKKYKEYPQFQRRLGKSAFVRRSLLNKVFGHRLPSLATVIKEGKQDKLRRELTRLAVKGVLGLFLNDAQVIKILSKGEQGLMELSTAIRNNIIVRSIQVLVANLISNSIQLALSQSGMTMRKAVKYQIEGMRLAKKYMETQIQLRELEVARIGTDGNEYKKLSDRILQLQEELSKNNASTLVEAGYLSSIVEDIAIVDSTFSYTGKLSKSLDKQVQKLPKTAQWIIGGALGSKDSYWYQTAYKFTQVSDFGSRYAMYKLAQEDGRLTPEFIDSIGDAFINYDRPSNKYLSYLGGIGQLWFLTYFMRVQSVLIRNTLKYPRKVLELAALMALAPMDIPTYFDAFFLTNDITNKIGFIDYAGLGLESLPISQVLL